MAATRGRWWRSALHATLGASFLIGAAFSSLSDAAVMVPIGLVLLLLGLLGLRSRNWQRGLSATEPSLMLAVFEIAPLILVLAIGFIFLLFVATHKVQRLNLAGGVPKMLGANPSGYPGKNGLGQQPVMRAASHTRVC